MPCVARAGYTLPGDNRIIDACGWQCTAHDPDEILGRCRLIATCVHRRRDGDRIRAIALCRRHFELAGPEAAAARS
jgi:hypothetical protein